MMQSINAEAQTFQFSVYPLPKTLGQKVTNSDIFLTSNPKARQMLVCPCDDIPIYISYFQAGGP